MKLLLVKDLTKCMSFCKMILQNDFFVTR